jgi:hypothetical protein
VDGCNLYRRSDFPNGGPSYVGIGRGTQAPTDDLVNLVELGFRGVERGVANEVAYLAHFLNERYADDAFNRADVTEIRRIAATCVTGCVLAGGGAVSQAVDVGGFKTRLMERAVTGVARRPAMTRLRPGS